MSFGLFEHLAATEDLDQQSQRRAVIASTHRVIDKFGAFLQNASSDEEKYQRFQIAANDIYSIVDEAAREFGANEISVRSAITSHFCPQPSFTKEAIRRPRLCPYHKQIVDISLAQGEPKAGYEAMSSHAWSDKHCESDDYQGDSCKFRPEMTTQSFWEDRSERNREKREERERQVREQEQIQTPEVTDQEIEPVVDSEPTEVTDGSDSGIDHELENAPSAVGGEHEANVTPAMHKARQLMAKTAQGTPPILNPGGGVTNQQPAGAGGMDPSQIHNTFSQIADPQGQHAGQWNPQLHTQQNYDAVGHQLGISPQQVQQGLQQFYQTGAGGGGNAQQAQQKAQLFQPAEQGMLPSGVAPSPNDVPNPTQQGQFLQPTQLPPPPNPTPQAPSPMVPQPNQGQQPGNVNQLFHSTIHTAGYSVEQLSDGSGRWKVVNDAGQAFGTYDTQQEAQAEANQLNRGVANNDGRNSSRVGINIDDMPMMQQRQQQQAPQQAPMDDLWNQAVQNYRAGGPHPAMQLPDHPNAQNFYSALTPEQQAEFAAKQVTNPHPNLGQPAYDAGTSVHDFYNSKVADSGNDGLGGPSPTMNKEKWTPSNPGKPKSDKENGRNPTKEIDIQEPITDEKTDDFLEGTRAQTTTQDVTETWNNEGSGPTKTFGDNGTKPVTRETQSSLHEAANLTRQHYNLIADLVKRAPGSGEELAKHFAEGLKDTNPNFNHERFMNAATPSSEDTEKESSTNPLKEILEDGFLPESALTAAISEYNES